MICSVVDAGALQSSRRRVFLGLFIALAVSLHAFESLLPTPVPWLRLGLANVMTLVALYLYDGRAAWSVSLARVGIGALLLGRLFSPGFWLALVGTLFATSAMIIMYRVAGRRLSPVGVSVIGAGGHALGQVLAARFLIVQHAAIWQVFPFFLLFTLFAGVLTGWLAASLLESLQQHRAFQSPTCAGEGLAEAHCQGKV